MEQIKFTGTEEVFMIEHPERYPYLYFPLAGECGLKSSVTPLLGGDSKINQSVFLLEPVSVENLHNNRSTRNFWCDIKGKGYWSATGVSAEELAKRFTEKEDGCRVEAGFMWHKVVRESAEYQMKAEITSFVLLDSNTEVMQVNLKNIGSDTMEIRPTAVIPIYGRSADNIRDHRHVTSLLHRICTTEYGIEVMPTLSFDEKGHRKNDMTYFVCGLDEEGNAPLDYYPTVDDVVAEGGTFECPAAVFKGRNGVKAGILLEGTEAVGGLRFGKKELQPGEETTYTVLMGITRQKEEIQTLIGRFGSKQLAERELENVKEYWRNAVNVSYQTADKSFGNFMKWVSFQPMLRRLFGCSFLPHHDYGKGGRGWRDLWQDCLALLIMNPQGVRQMLLDNFAGVRMDGTNATIIGTKQGEFIADRNNITRVWMDHGVWPFMTTQFYIHQTGDLGLLEEQAPYFKDKQICRGTQIDDKWEESSGCWQKTELGAVHEGSIMEHLLLQNLTAFYEVGEHNVIRLRGADWNDALDMAEERGESVAFTNAYAGNMKDLATLLQLYSKHTGTETVLISEEVLSLLQDNKSLYDSVQKKNEVLRKYLELCRHTVSGKKEEVTVQYLVNNLNHKADWLMEHVREKEWVQDKAGNGWFNGYYDNHGKKVEGEFETGIRMMLTSQVFSIMSGTAQQEQIEAVIKSADQYLYEERLGGYRLNTDFGEVKEDLGRMFGFSYGDKENGAVFSHMAVMYGNALYRRGFVKEGFKALNALAKQSMRFKVSQIYPGIPEYFNGKGRGLYHYLTGAASWYMLTVITEMFGVRGELGELRLEPKLLAEQFDETGKAGLELQFAGKQWKVVYINAEGREYGDYRIGKAFLDGTELEAGNETFIQLSKQCIGALCDEKRHVVEVFLV